jgi:hypothetical protein
VSIGDDETHAQIEGLYRSWILALQRREFGWFEQYLADNYTCTAHPFTNFFLDKNAFIEADKKVGVIEVEFVTVLTHRIGNVVLSNLIIKVIREAHTADLGEGLPTAAAMADAVTGKTVAYASAWRSRDGRWECYDHHLVGPIE